MYFLSGEVNLAEATKNRVKVQGLRPGRYLHPSAPNGVLDLTKERIKAIFDNFKAGVRGKMLPCDENHEDKKKTNAKSWIVDMELDSEGGLDLIHEFSDADLEQRVREKKVRFFSPELALNWKDPSDGQIKDTMFAGAWTNLPYIKGMRGAVALLSELANQPGMSDIASRKDDDDSKGDGENDLSRAKDPDAKSADLPNQCASCAHLYDGDCPFAGIPVKTAAAGDGLCPQYEDVEGQPSEEARRKTQGPTNMPNPNPNPTPNSTPPGDKPPVRLSEEELKAIELSVKTEYEAKLAEMEAKANSVQAEMNRVIEERNRDNDNKRVSQLVADGKITAHQGQIALNILAASRMGGTIELSDADGNKASHSTAELFLNFLDAAEKQVDLSSAKTVTPPSGYDSTAAADAKATAMAKERANGTGRPWTDFYGECLRAVKENN